MTKRIVKVNLFTTHDLDVYTSEERCMVFCDFLKHILHNESIEFKKINFELDGQGFGTESVGTLEVQADD